ncbi:MAG: flagellar assembly protein FliW [Acidobacteriota bacterium]
MPSVKTAFFGEVEYTEDSVVDFPAGLPAFESERSFIRLYPPDYQPLFFLQSLSTPSLSFLAISMQNVMVNYELELSDEDTCLLGGPRPATDFDVVALITVSEQGDVSANLKAPLVIQERDRLGVQAIQSNLAYSFRHPLGTAPWPGNGTPCS